MDGQVESEGRVKGKGDWWSKAKIGNVDGTNWSKWFRWFIRRQVADGVAQRRSNHHVWRVFCTEANESSKFPL